MDKPQDGLAFLAELRRQNGKEKQDYSRFKHFLESKARKKGIPITGQFELTPLCNLSCKMCYVHLMPEQMMGRKILPTETWKDLIHQAWEAGMIQASLTGGECLTYPGFDELYLYLHSLGCEVCIMSNGILMDEKRIRFFQKHPPSRIRITLYGYNDDVYERVTGQRAFHTVSENIRKIKDANLPVAVSITPNSFLGEDVLGTLRAAKKLTENVTVNDILFIPREETGRAQLDWAEDQELRVRILRLQNELEGIETTEIDEDKLPPIGGPHHECTKCGVDCGAGRSAFVIDWKGTMVACNRLEMIQGHPLEEGFAASWAKINREANAWPRVPECEECPYFKVCQNCAGNTLLYTEAGKQPKALCERTKYFVQHGVAQLPECD